MYNIIVLCAGNTGLSPMAQALLQRELDKRGVQADVQSAGVSARDGEPPARHAVTVMAEQGLDISQHTSRFFNRAMMRQADLILTMERRQASMVQMVQPTEGDVPVYTIKAFAGAAGSENLPDPFMGSLETYRACARALAEAVVAAAEMLQRVQGCME